jgi:glyoxylase-like metal-dependent hydrolase (beta-lactamase superfamily II)
MNTALSRRSFLRSATLAAVAMGLPVLSSSSRAAQVIEPTGQSRNAGFYRFKLGSFELISVSDGVLTVPAAVFAGNASPEQLQAVLQSSFESETLTPDCNVLYVNTGQNKILIDTGSGSGMGATAGKLLENLQAAQITPAEIDTVILTHAHGDHVGGLLDAAGAPVFANAQFHMSRVEHDFWIQPQVNLPKIGIDAAAQQQMIDTAQKQLGAIADRLTLFEAGQEILPGFVAIQAFGHTPGQVAIRITSGSESLTHTADVVHTRSINLWHPDWQPIFDADPDQAVTTRKQILQTISDARELMYAYHFPYPGLGHILPRPEGGFTWEPVNWQFEG